MFLFKKKECTHDKISPDKSGQYCPDCGKYVENKWFLTRCACCNVKRVSTAKYNEVMPIEKFCPNCGHTHYYIEEIKNINFIDINYAVLLKIVNENLTPSFSQGWLERENTEPIKLLGLIHQQ